MPNSKNQNQHGGASQSVRQSSQDAGANPQPGAETVTDRFREGYGIAQERAVQGYHQAEDLVARNPTSSVLISLGVGFGLGLVLTSLLAREESWAEKHLSEMLRNVPDRYHRLVDSVRSLPGTVHDHLPSSIAKHLG